MVPLNFLCSYACNIQDRDLNVSKQTYCRMGNYSCGHWLLLCDDDELLYHHCQCHCFRYQLKININSIGCSSLKSLPWLLNWLMKTHLDWIFSSLEGFIVSQWLLNLEVVLFFLLTIQFLGVMDLYAYQYCHNESKDASD